MVRAALGGLGVAAALVGTVVAAPPASAHALVRGSNPADGTILETPPRQVVVTFTEPPDPGLSSIRVLDSTGRPVSAAPSEPVPGRPLELRVPLPASLSRGVYTVTWRAVSRVDGHVTAGAFSFGVGVVPAPAASSTRVQEATAPWPSPAAVAGRWAFYWGLAVLLGGAGAGLLWWPGLPGRGRPLAAGAWVAAVAGLTVMVLAERASVGVSLGSFLRSSTGREYLWRAGALGLVTLTAGALLARPGRPALAALGTATAAAMLVHARGGHGAAGPLPWFNVVVQWLHLLAVGAWVGGLPWLLLALGRERGERRAAAVRGFSTLAGLSLAVVALTGLSRALDEVGWPQHWGRLVDTRFGLVLLVKATLIAGLVAIGARNRYRNVPRAVDRAGARSLGRSVGLELVVAGLILAATGVLSEVPPSATVAAAASRPTVSSVVVSGSDLATTTRVRLTVTPGLVGPNRFEARVTDYDTGRPVAARSVRLTFSLPGRPDLGSERLALSRAGGGLWVGQGTALSMDGRWSVTVLVQEAATAVEVPLTLQTRLPPEQVTVSRAAGQPTIYTILLAGKSTLQAYLDPAAPGPSTVHFTFFTPSGGELPIASASATQTPPSGVPRDLPLRRFGAGHFVGDATLTPGRWRFQIQATGRDGRTYGAYFDQIIPTAEGASP